MNTAIAFILFFFTAISNTIGQAAVSLIQNNSTVNKYLFYLPGGIVLDQGINAVSKDFGPYKYLEILDTLKSYGFTVFGEVMPKGTEEVKYVNKVSKQIDSLLHAKVSPENIIVIGASAGAYITVDIASALANRKINYVIMGMCWPDTYKTYTGKSICGNFLSIYEASDAHGSCNKLFDNRDCITAFKEIELNMNNSHGFIYSPYKEWVQPIIDWINEKR